MKRLLLACTVSVLSALSSFGQGTVVFANTATSLVITNDLLGHIGGVRTNDLAKVTLYYSIAATAPAVNTMDPYDLSGWTLSSPTTADVVPVIYFVPGRFSGGTQTLDSAPGGGLVWLMVRGWTGGYADWMSAVNAANQPGSTVFLGMSEAWQQPTGNPFGTPPTAAIPMYIGAGGFTGLTLSPIPEPSTFALCGLGGIAFAFYTSRRLRQGR